MNPMEEQKIKNTLELKGIQQVQTIYKDAGIDCTSATQVLAAIGNNTIIEERLKNIIDTGMTEFEQQMGRKMTYGEMRELYG